VPVDEHAGRDTKFGETEILQACTYLLIGELHVDRSLQVPIDVPGSLPEEPVSLHLAQDGEVAPLCPTMLLDHADRMVVGALIPFIQRRIGACRTRPWARSRA
jgi:hypothetical protein